MHLDAVRNDPPTSGLFKAPARIVMRGVQLDIMSENFHGFGDVHNQSLCASYPQIRVYDNNLHLILTRHAHMVAITMTALAVSKDVDCESDQQTI
jgi:hypothetical protein